MNETTYLKTFLFTISLILIILVARAIATGNYFLAFGILASLFVGGITFLNPENGLIVLVFSMLLSPEIEIARIPGRSVTLRIDDLLLISVFISFLTYHAINFYARRFRHSPIDKPLIAMVIIYIISTSLGIMEGRLKPLTSIFFALKYIQYFILYWLTLNIVNSRQTLINIIKAGAITALIVCVYAYSLFPKVHRVYPPFDYESIGGVGVGESATLGGYLLIVMAQAIAFFLNSEKKIIRYLCLGFLIFCLPPFARTLSRASYYSFAAMWIAFIFITPKRKSLWIFITIASLILAPLIASNLIQTVMERLRETFTGPVSDLGIDLELSAAARVENWLKAFREWLPAHPFLGHGATGVGLVDAQYPRILGEFGLIGFAVFVWLIFTIIKSVRNVKYKIFTDDVMLSISSGFMASLVALLVQAIGVNTFIIVRIMTPFWFLTGTIMALPYITNREG